MEVQKSRGVRTQGGWETVVSSMVFRGGTLRSALGVLRSLFVRVRARPHVFHLIFERFNSTKPVS